MSALCNSSMSANKAVSRPVGSKCVAYRRPASSIGYASSLAACPEHAKCTLEEAAMLAQLSCQLPEHPPLTCPKHEKVISSLIDTPIIGLSRWMLCRLLLSSAIDTISDLTIHCLLLLVTYACCRSIGQNQQVLQRVPHASRRLKPP